MNKVTVLLPYKRRSKGRPLFAVKNVYSPNVRIKRISGYSLIQSDSSVEVLRELKRLGLSDGSDIHTETVYDLTSNTKVTILLVRCKYKLHSNDNMSWVTMADLLTKSTASKGLLSKIHKFARSPISLSRD